LAALALRIAGRAFAALTLLLAGCTKPPPDDGRREVVAPAAVAPPARPAPRQVIRTTWNFESGNDECTATAAGGSTSLRVAIRRDAPIRLMLSLAAQLEPRPAGRSAVPLRFAGPTGTWQVSAQQTGSRQLTATLGSDNTALGRLLILLGGGVLDVAESEQSIASVGVAPSGAPGQLWFDCARGKMI
jgi:hypothetical protein